MIEHIANYLMVYIQYVFEEERYVLFHMKTLIILAQWKQQLHYFYL